MAGLTDPDNLQDLRDSLIEMISPGDLNANLANEAAALEEATQDHVFKSLEINFGDSEEAYFFERSLARGNASAEETWEALTSMVTSSSETLKGLLKTNFQNALQFARRFELMEDFPFSDWYHVLKASQSNRRRSCSPSSYVVQSRADGLSSYWQTVLDCCAPDEVSTYNLPLHGSRLGDWGYVWASLVNGSVSSWRRREWLDRWASLANHPDVLDDKYHVRSLLLQRGSDSDPRPNRAIVKHALELARQKGLKEEKGPLHEWALTQPEIVLAPDEYPWAFWMIQLKNLKDPKREDRAQEFLEDVRRHRDGDPESWQEWLKAPAYPETIVPKYTSASSFFDKVKEDGIRITLDVLQQAVRVMKLQPLDFGFLEAEFRQETLNNLSLPTLASPRRHRPRS